jgi:hypothetical protein
MAPGSRRYVKVKPADLRKLRDLAEVGTHLLVAIRLVAAYPVVAGWYTCNLCGNRYKNGHTEDCPVRIVEDFYGETCKVTICGDVHWVKREADEDAKDS